MAHHQFTYTVSGFELSDAQKAAISQEIAAVVTRVVLGESREELQPELLSRLGIAGGKMIAAAEAKSAGRVIEDFISTGCGGGGSTFE